MIPTAAIRPLPAEPLPRRPIELDPTRHNPYDMWVEPGAAPPRMYLHYTKLGAYLRLVWTGYPATPKNRRVIIKWASWSCWQPAR